MQRRDKLWVENIENLFNSNKIVPSDGMTLEHKLNALTRLVILIFIVLLLLFDISYALIFLLLSLLFIIILYYIQKKNMQENYSFENGQDYSCRNEQANLSKNGRFVLEANPKTKIAPVLTPSGYNISQWRDDDYGEYSHINSPKKDYEYEPKNVTQEHVNNNKKRKSKYYSGGNCEKSHYNVAIPSIVNTYGQSNISDTRLTSYGDPRRAYYDPMSAQTKFYYDDINTMAYPSYITRSNVDHIPGLETYGPIQAGFQHGNQNTMHVREIAENAYLENQLKFREDISYSLSEKRRAIEVQRNIAPLGRTIR